MLGINKNSRKFDALQKETLRFFSKKTASNQLRFLYFKTTTQIFLTDFMITNPRFQSILALDLIFIRIKKSVTVMKLLEINGVSGQAAQLVPLA